MILRIHTLLNMFVGCSDEIVLSMSHDICLGTLKKKLDKSTGINDGNGLFEHGTSRRGHTSCRYDLLCRVEVELFNLTWMLTADS